MAATVLPMQREPSPTRLTRCSHATIHPASFPDSSTNLRASPHLVAPRDRTNALLEPAHRALQRPAHLLPSFNHPPIHGPKQQMLAPPTNESLFDFREIIKIVHRKGPGVGGQGLVKALSRPPSPVPRPLPFVYQSQSFERERVVNGINQFRACGDERGEAAGGD